MVNVQNEIWYVFIVFLIAGVGCFILLLPPSFADTQAHMIAKFEGAETDSNFFQYKIGISGFIPPLAKEEIRMISEGQGDKMLQLLVKENSNYNPVTGITFFFDEKIQTIILTGDIFLCNDYKIRMKRLNGENESLFVVEGQDEFYSKATDKIMEELDNNGNLSYYIKIENVKKPVTIKDILVRVKETSGIYEVNWNDYRAGGENLEKYYSINLKGDFKPDKNYQVLIPSAEQKEVIPIAQVRHLDISKLTNEYLKAYLSRSFFYSYSFYAPTKINGLGSQLNLAYRIPFKRKFSMEIRSEGIINSNKKSGELQNRLNLGGTIKYMNYFNATLGFKISEESKANATLENPFGIKLYLGIEANQDFSKVDFLAKPEVLLYVYYLFGDLEYYWIKLTHSKRYFSPPYITFSYSRVQPVRYTNITEYNGEEKKPAGENRIEMEFKWIFPILNVVDLTTELCGFYGNGKSLTTEIKGFKNFFDIKGDIYLDKKKTKSIFAGYQRGKLPPEFDFSHCFYFGFGIKEGG